MSALEKIEQFLNNNKELLNDYNFKAIYSSTKLDSKEIGLMTNILLKAGFNPLQYLDHVPYAFLYGQTDVTTIDIPNNVNYIDLYTFASCTNLKSVIIPNSVEHIDDGVFSGCTSLNEIVIPNSVTSIGDAAFDGCDELTEVTINSDIEEIGYSAFGNCNKLLRIDYDGTREQWLKIDKNPSWSIRSKIKEINCTDGIINIRQVLTNPHV